MVTTLRELRERYEAAEAALEAQIPEWDHVAEEQLRAKLRDADDELSLDDSLRERDERRLVDITKQRADLAPRWMPRLFWGSERRESVAKLDDEISEINTRQEGSTERHDLAQAKCDLAEADLALATQYFYECVAASRAASQQLQPQRELLEQMRDRQREVEASALTRGDVRVAFDAMFADDYTPSDSERTLVKIAVYADRWAQPGQSVRDVCQQPASIDAQWREYASIVNDALSFSGRNAVRPLPSTDNESFVAEYIADDEFDDSIYELLEAQGSAQLRPRGGPASSWDDHFIGPAGDDWASGEPPYYLHSLGGDDTWISECWQRKVWLKARAMRQREEAGERVLPVGILKVASPPEVEFCSMVLDPTDPYIRAAAARLSTNYSVNSLLDLVVVETSAAKSAARNVSVQEL